MAISYMEDRSPIVFGQKMYVIVFVCTEYTNNRESHYLRTEKGNGLANKERDYFFHC